MALKKTAAAALVLIIFPALSSGSSAVRQVNFPVMPPPVAYPYFSDDDVDVKFRYNYGRFRGDNLSATSSGGDFVHRFALNDRAALGYQAGLNYTRGKTGAGLQESEIFFKEIPLTVDAELMALKGGFFRALIFAGAGYSYMKGEGAEVIASGRIVETRVMRMKGSMRGGQGGIMGGLYRGELDISLLFAYQYREGGFAMKSGSYVFGGRITPFHTYSLGLDIAYRGITLGFMRQMAGASGNNRKYTADIFSLSAYMNF